MAMVKSAVRMRLATSSEPQVLLEDLNRVISELIGAEMFVTVAFVSLGKSNDLHFATAGHLPFSTSAAPLDRSANFPLHPPIGIFKERKFASSHVEFSSGDIAVLLTDGLTEAANENEEEYGSKESNNRWRSIPERRSRFSAKYCWGKRGSSANKWMIRVCCW